MCMLQEPYTVGPIPDASNASGVDNIRAANRALLPDLKRDCPEFVGWFDRLSHWGGNIIDACWLVRDDTEGSGASKAATYRVRLFTANHDYRVAVRPPSRSDKGYLGGQVSTRKPRAGEDWTRGNDLHDGPYAEGTWHRILADIVAYELVQLGK